MLHKKSERGQAIIMIVFSIIGIIGLTALTVDGGIAYTDRRSAQGAADSAAWAAGLTNSRNGDVTAIQNAAKAIADKNGYTGDGTRSVVTVNVKSLPMAPAPIIVTDAAGNPVYNPDGSVQTIPNPCPERASPNVEITVDIVSYVKTFFAPVIGVERVTNHVTAVTRACGTYVGPIFGGNVIVNINDSTSTCGFDSNTGSALWRIRGGGIASNGCATAKGNVTLDDSECVSAVGGATGFGTAAKICPGTPIPYSQEYIDSIMPPNPCLSGGEGLPQSSGVTTTVKGVKTTTFGDGETPKVYCITDMDALDSTNIVTNNATLYVTDTEFNLKFSGGGGFSGTPSKSGNYSSLIVVIPQDPSDPTCSSFNSAQNDQVLNYRGNASGIPWGTVLAPGACVDLRGNATSTINGQVVGYSVSANGDANTTINYVDTQNYQPPADPTIILVK